MNYNKSGWLFQSGKIRNITQEIARSDIYDLLKLADEDNKWAESVRKGTLRRDRIMQGKETGKIDPLLDYFQVMNTGGTIVHYPFGRIITFASRRHIFRGENKRFKYSESTLSRKVRGKDPKEAELLHAVSNMRVAQFSKVIWRLNVVPYWEANISEVNYKALAQHYGFDTYLLDLTNDFKIALFFATCKYVDGKYYPLEKRDIEHNDESRYGVIFHSADWAVDFLNGTNVIDWNNKHYEPDRKRTYVIDQGCLDGYAFQIGLQPFYRCHMQSGFVFPMKTVAPLQDDMRFEKLVFRQSPELSEEVFHMMHDGKDVFPDEGISDGMGVLDEIKNGKVFSEDDLKWAYDLDECNKDIFPTIDNLKDELLKQGFEIQKEEVPYHFKRAQLRRINKRYDGRDLLAPVGGAFHQLPEDKAFRKQRYEEIYGKRDT